MEYSRHFNGKIDVVGNDSNGSFPPIIVPFCLRIQTYPLTEKILLWDFLLFVPNVFFVIFLLFKWCRVRERFHLNNFPIMSIFFNLILLVSVLSIIRCLVSTFIKPDENDESGIIINKIMWLIVRFSQLATECSVVFFGLFFGRLESQKSIYRIMALTIPLSMIYIIIQGVLEFLLKDEHYIINDKKNHYFDLYGHGGMVFWFISSIIFFTIYLVIVLLPHTRVRNYFPLPTKRSFYVYCLLLAILSAAQTIGSAITYSNLGINSDGLCILDSTTYIYFTLFCPLVYIVFLKKFFNKGIKTSTIKNDNMNINTEETTNEVNIQSPDRDNRSNTSTFIANNPEILNSATNLIGQRPMLFRRPDEISSYSSFRDEFIRSNFNRSDSIEEEEHFYINNDEECVTANNRPK